MAIISLKIPDDMVEGMGGGGEAVSREIVLAAAFYWCRRGDLSTGEAARLAGLTYAGFLEAAVQRQATLYDYDFQEIKAEISRPLPEGIDFEDIEQSVSRAHAAGR